MANGDDDDEDDDVTIIGDNTSRSKQEAIPEPVPTAPKKPKNGNNKPVDSSSSSSSSSSSVTPSRVDDTISTIEEMGRQLKSLLKDSSADKEAIDKLSKLQADINKITLRLWKRVDSRTRKADHQVSDLHSFYVQKNKQIDKLVHNTRVIINTLYQSYLDMAIRYHSIAWWDHPASNHTHYYAMVSRMINSIHPQPIAPTGDRFDFTFGRQCDAMDTFRLFNEEDTRLLVESEADNSSVSVFRFSTELRSRLYSLGQIPPTGMISTDKRFSDPVTNNLFKVECRALHGIDSFSNFTRSNYWFYETTKKYVTESSDDKPVSWYPPGAGKEDEDGDNKDDHGEEGKDKDVSGGDDNSNNDGDDNDGNGDKNSEK